MLQKNNLSKKLVLDSCKGGHPQKAAKRKTPELKKKIYQLIKGKI